MAESEWYPTGSGRQQMETGGGDVGGESGQCYWNISPHISPLIIPLT